MTPDTLRASLVSLGYSPRELAEAFGVHPVTVRKWLSGMQPIPAWVPKFLAILMRTAPQRRNRS